MVDPRSPFTFVLRHSLDYQCFGIKRVSQHPLQGFDLTVSAFFLCLYNTHLQLFHVGFSHGKVNAFPAVCYYASRRTRFHVHLLSSFQKFCKLSCKERPRLVSLLSHGIAFKPLSVSITESAFAFSPPFYLHPVRPCLHSAYHPKMERYRLTTFRIIHHVLSDYRRFRLRLSADSRYVRVTPNWKKSSDCTPFGSSLSAVLACS